MAKRTMNTTPDRSEYRRSFVACGGGPRFRLKGTSGFEGRRIFMDSLHVDRRPSGDGVVRFLRGIPAFRIVGPEHVDLHTELFLQEAGDLPDIGQRRLEEDFRGFGPRIDLARDRLRVLRIHHEAVAPEAMPDLFAQVRDERSEQLRLDVDEPPEDVDLGSAFGPPDVPGPRGL